MPDNGKRLCDHHRTFRKTQDGCERVHYSSRLVATAYWLLVDTLLAESFVLREVKLITGRICLAFLVPFGFHRVSIAFVEPRRFDHEFLGRDLISVVIFKGGAIGHFEMTKIE